MYANTCTHGYTCANLWTALFVAVWIKRVGMTEESLHSVLSTKKDPWFFSQLVGLIDMYRINKMIRVPTTNESSVRPYALPKSISQPYHQISLTTIVQTFVKVVFGFWQLTKSGWMVKQNDWISSFLFSICHPIVFHEWRYRILVEGLEALFSYQNEYLKSDIKVRILCCLYTVRINLLAAKVPLVRNMIDLKSTIKVKISHSF